MSPDQIRRALNEFARALQTAEDVIAAYVSGPFPADLFCDEARFIVAALREACGGGDIVIRTDGTLATLRHPRFNDPDAWSVVPVERGA